MSKPDIQAWSARHRKRDSTGGRLALDWAGVAPYALLHGLNADAVARCHPEPDWMMVCTQLATKFFDKTLTNNF